MGTDSSGKPVPVDWQEIYSGFHSEIERAEKKVRLEEIKSHIKIFNHIIDADKTPTYGYDKSEQNKNNRGLFSYAGRWKTPREYCQDELKIKEEALAEMEKGEK